MPFYDEHRHGKPSRWQWLWGVTGAAFLAILVIMMVI